MQGEVAIDLEDRGQETLLRRQAEINVGGVVAGVGQRILGGVAQMTVDQCFKKMEEFI